MDSARELRKSFYNFAFQGFCLISVLISLSLVVILVVSLSIKGWNGFFQTYIINDGENDIDSTMSKLVLSLSIDEQQLTRQSKSQLRNLVSARLVRKDKLVLASAPVDQFFKGNSSKLSSKQKVWVQSLKDRGALVKKWNWDFFVSSDSREGELAGIGSALISSIMIIAIMICFSIPTSLASALHLQEFSKKKSFPVFSILINNLAAVPSVLFGMLGLVLFIELLEFPRSSSLTGGVVLALMILPTLIISCRSALAAVPNYLRQSAYALGASRMQVVFHHVILYASPGLLTSFVLSICQGIGQTAPLLIIGMMAFSPSLPASFMDPATGLPVQIYLWADNPDGSFMEKAAAAVLCLLFFLVLLNLSMFVGRLYLQNKYPVSR